ncbi:MAG: PocR ligand-binding domain-containing protein [Clostridiales bacterium]|nr:PocR ligand-binding domain-containing protein [Clostridiales bacterium]
MLDYDINELRKICSDLTILSGLKIDLWDENKQLLFSYPHKHRRFCEIVRQCPGLCERCLESDARGFEFADRTGGIYSYKCHMGLTETIVPIITDGTLIGYLMLGQAIETENLPEIEERIKTAAQYGADTEKMTLTVRSDSKTSRAKISAAANVLDMLTGYLRQKNIVGKRRTELFRIAEEYISSHISEPLSVDMLCGHLNISKTSLYHLSVENCGTGITGFIRKKRIEKAAHLIESSDLDTQQIADLVGIPDTNYFIKVFKAETGMTPAAYKKLRDARPAE